MIRKMNKKGLLDLSALTNGLQSIISIIPNWLKFVIFLFLLALFGYLISMIFQVFGIYCNSADEPVNTGSIISGITLLGEVPDPKLLNKEALEMEEGGISVISEQITFCSRQLPSGTIYYENDTASNFSTPTWFYEGRFCTDCETADVCGIASDCQKLCIGNVNRKEDKSILQRTFCGGLACEPPLHYTYDYQRNIYVCNDESCAGQTIGKKWDELLASKGATIMYPHVDSQRKTGAKDMLSIKCEELRPRLAIYGFDILNFNVIIFCLVIFVLLWLYFHLK
jgi:hypothetical protein